MNIKTILIGVAVVAILAVGGYFLFMNNSSPAAGDQPAAAAGATDKVEAQDVVIGTGTTAEPNTLVSVLYVGRLQDGTVFDSSEANGNQPLVFQLGAPNIIPGFQIGINGMKVGGERRMAIPASLAYGAQEIKHPTTGEVVVPANSTLIFDVKLVDVKPAPAAPPAATAPAGQ